MNRRVGRPSRAEASVKALEGIDPAEVDPLVLRQVKNRRGVRTPIGAGVTPADPTESECYRVFARRAGGQSSINIHTIMPVRPQNLIQCIGPKILSLSRNESAVPSISQCLFVDA